MAQQTALEWLMEKLRPYIHYPYGHSSGYDMEDVIEQAKQMEKEQIKMAYNDGADHMVESKYEGMDNYYKLRYGSDNQI